MTLLPRFLSRTYRKMSIFVQKHNPITGQNAWIVREEDYDYHQEVARSSFADMLHDTERNQKYELALKKAIEFTHASGRQAHVLDIGTGTGLLSMMAARHGADSITACEAFKPMSECASRIIKRNGLENRIKIIPKLSTDLTEGDLGRRCNILVTEVFDTELIGEGALATFRQAHEALLEKDCIVIPQSATIYAQIVESPFIQNWNRVKDVYDDDGKLLIEAPSSVKTCAGSAAVHDLQLSQVKLSLIKSIVGPLPVFRFDWSGRTPLMFEQSTIHTVKAEYSGVAQAVLVWWDLQMDFEGKIILSCAPNWGPPDASPWRDHWMQAVYYLPREVIVEKETELSLISCHDEFSLWFNLKTDLKLSHVDYLKPVCECGVHVAFSRTRIGQINDSVRNKKYLGVLERHVNSDSVVLILSDGFYSSLCAVKMGAKKVYYVETNSLSRRILLDFVKCNELENVEVFENFESLEKSVEEKINLVLGEPYFLNSILPWDHLLFTYLLKGVRNILTSDVKVFPKVAIIKGIAVRFAHLNKIRLPLDECEGFKMKDFDELIEASSNISDDNVEAQPLWEYPGIALSEMVDITRIDLSSVPQNVVETGVFDIEKGYGSCNGVALWVEWLLDERVVSLGPSCPPQIGDFISWDVHTRQGVCLFEDRDVKQIEYSFEIDYDEGNVTFRCN